MKCRKCGGDVKSSNDTLCEDCLMDPDVSPSVDGVRIPSFLRDLAARKQNAFEHMRPEQKSAHDRIAEQE